MVKNNVTDPRLEDWSGVKWSGFHGVFLPMGDSKEGSLLYFEKVCGSGNLKCCVYFAHLKGSAGVENKMMT